MKKLATLSLMIASALILFACNESKEVQLGPKTDSRIKQGEEAQKKLSRQVALDSEVRKLEEQMDNWIEKASSTKQPPNQILTVFAIVKSETECSLRVESTYIDDRTFSEAIRGIAKAYPHCQNIIVIADRLHVPPAQMLSSSGRNLILIADVIDLDGTISTEGIPVGANENGKPGGNLNIYTLALRKGPGGRLITKGSNAGAFRYEPKTLTAKQTETLRTEAAKTGVSFDKEVSSPRRVDCSVRPSENLGSAFLYIEDGAKSYLRNLHPDFAGRAPNPFREKSRVLVIDGSVYFWKIDEEKIELTPVANNRLTIEVPQIDQDYFRKGGEAGALAVHIASNTPSDTPQLEVHEGTDAIENLPEYSEWITSALDDPIAVRHKDLVRYTFALYTRKNKTDIKLKAWTVTKAQTAEVQEVEPRLKLQTRVIDRQDPSKANTPTAPAPEKFIFVKGDASFIEDLNRTSGIEGNNLPDGIKNLKAWQKDWDDLEARAKQLGLTVKRKAN